MPLKIQSNMAIISYSSTYCFVLLPVFQRHLYLLPSHILCSSHTEFLWFPEDTILFQNHVPMGRVFPLLGICKQLNFAYPSKICTKLTSFCGTLPATPDFLCFFTYLSPPLKWCPWCRKNNFFILNPKLPKT